MNEYSFDQIEVGKEEQFVAIITEDMMSAFCDISGDINPLHMDSDYAQFQNFKDRLVYGLLTASFYSTLIGVYLPGKNAMLQSLNIKFQKPVFVGDKLNIFGEITHMSEVYKVVEIKSIILNQDREKVSTAKITAGLFR
jgi:3-hydroxybutyryl-CoA dehydratase